MILYWNVPKGLATAISTFNYKKIVGHAELDEAHDFLHLSSIVSS